MPAAHSAAFARRALKVYRLAIRACPWPDRCSITKRQNAVLFVSLFLVFVGSRAAVINYGGNSVPFGDEWDAVAAGLLRPYMQGNLKLAELFSAHNEHVIFFTRFADFVDFQDLRLLGRHFTNDRQCDPRRADGRGDQRGAFANAPGGWAQIAMISYPSSSTPFPWAGKT